MIIPNNIRNIIYYITRYVKYISLKNQSKNQIKTFLDFIPYVLIIKYIVNYVNKPY